MVVRYHLANHETADLLLYLFSSVSSLKSMLDEVSNGLVEDMEAMEAAKAASLLKLLRLVAKGLKSDQKWIRIQNGTKCIFYLEYFGIAPSLCEETKVEDWPSGGGRGPTG